MSWIKITSDRCVDKPMKNLKSSRTMAERNERSRYEVPRILLFSYVLLLARSPRSANKRPLLSIQINVPTQRSYNLVMPFIALWYLDCYVSIRSLVKANNDFTQTVRYFWTAYASVRETIAAFRCLKSWNDSVHSSSKAIPERITPILS